MNLGHADELDTEVRGYSSTALAAGAAIGGGGAVLVTIAVQAGKTAAEKATPEGTAQTWKNTWQQGMQNQTTQSQ